MELELTKAGRVKLTSKFARECVSDLYHDAMIGLSDTVLQERNIGKAFKSFANDTNTYKLLSPEDTATINELANKIDQLIGQFCELGDRASYAYVKHLESILNDRNKLEAYIKKRFNAIPQLNK